MTGVRHRYLRGVGCGAVVALAIAGCTRPGTPPRTTTTTAPQPTTTLPRTTTTAGHGGHDHETPDRLNHAPTEEQKKAALKWVDDTRAAVKRQGLTVAKLQEQHYVPIGDGVHWVKPEFTRDEYFLDPERIESFAVFGGQIAAAMYVYNSKGLNTTLNDVPDIAGSWTMWHGHTLPYASNDPTTDDFFKLKFFPPNFVRNDSPMVHAWIIPNKCGPWASAGVGEGSCVPELANY